MTITQTITVTTGTVHLTAPYTGRHTSPWWVEAVDNPSKRLCLLEPSDRAINECATRAILDEVKRGLRWGKHQSSVPFFRSPIRPQCCVDSRLNLFEMPLETFYMIAALLSPRDLLKLSRSSKGVREKLMTRKARWVWREVIEREGLPDCPEGMSEPAYLAFLYDEECMSCDIPYPSVDFRHAFMRLRLCEDCAEINIRSKDEMIEELEEQCRNTPRDIKLLLDILPGYQAEDFDAHSSLVSHDVHDFNGTPEENSLVFQPEVDVLIDAFYAAKSKGVGPFHKFYNGRRAVKAKQEEKARLLAQTAKSILMSQLHVKDLLVPPPDVSPPRRTTKTRPGRAAQLPSPDSSDSETPEDDDEWDLDSDSDSDSDWHA